MWRRLPRQPRFPASGQAEIPGKRVSVSIDAFDSTASAAQPRQNPLSCNFHALALVSRPIEKLVEPVRHNRWRQCKSRSATTEDGRRTMPRKPNYRFERSERDRAKDAKKEEKLKRRRDRLTEAQDEDLAGPNVADKPEKR
jgi:hypothetical protein